MDMAAAEVTATVAPAAMSAATAMTATAMSAATAPRKCAAGKDERKHGNRHDKSGHWHAPADFPRKR